MAEHNRLVAIIFMLVACISSAVASETVNFQHLSLNSMFPQITINGLYQDESGVLWIGTKDGVKKYNGNYIESVNFMGINNWIQSNLVPTICGDKKGHLYVNTDYSIIEYDLIKEESRTHRYCRPSLSTTASTLYGSVYWTVSIIIRKEYARPNTKLTVIT